MTPKQHQWSKEKWLVTDETDISEEEAYFNRKLAFRCIQALGRNNITALYAPSRNDALALVLDMIPPEAKVGMGDSTTLFQIGLISELEKNSRNELIFASRKEGKYYFPGSTERFVEIGLEALHADIFVCGVNAVTLDGKLVSTDAEGSRISGLLFGPPKVIIVAGVNKIVANFQEARERVSRIVGPMVAMRHRIKHQRETMPDCAETGVCDDCDSPRRICCYTTIVEFDRRNRIQVVLVGERLGI